MDCADVVLGVLGGTDSQVGEVGTIWEAARVRHEVDGLTGSGPGSKRHVSVLSSESHDETIRAAGRSIAAAIWPSRTVASRHSDRIVPTSPVRISLLRSRCRNKGRHNRRCGDVGNAEIWSGSEDRCSSVARSGGPGCHRRVRSPEHGSGIWPGCAVAVQASSMSLVRSGIIALVTEYRVSFDATAQHFAGSDRARPHVLTRCAWPA